jgi:NitT/TauT family transport system ATP-binding protein
VSELPPVDKAPLLQLEGVSKVFANGVAALDHVALQVAQREFVAILGASGCGKSTLLRLIAGLAKPSGGRIQWRGGPIQPGQIGFVFQDPTLMPWATVIENVFLPLRLAGQSLDSVRERIGEILALVGLADFAGAYPRELSGGMRMRTSIARALVTKPSVLLLDEPFAALDELTRFRLNEDLLRLWRTQNLTVLFVTHSVFESVFLSNRVVVMSARPGRVAADLPVYFAKDRDSKLRTTPEFGAQCQVVSDALARAGS